MLVQSGDITSSKAGIYSESFQCRTEKLGLCFSLCGYAMCKEGTVHNTICQECSSGGKEKLSAVILGLSLLVSKVMEKPVLPAPTLSHTAVHVLCVSVCAQSCAQFQGWILLSYRSVSKITLLLWRRLAPAVGWIIPTSPPSVFVCLSFFPGVSAAKSLPKIFWWAFFWYRNLWISLQIIRGRISL